jgi:gliding motility-associated-like protein
MQLLTRYEKLYCIFSVVILSFFSNTVSAQVNISSGQSAQAMAQKLVGPGITIQNPSLTCAAIANGTFQVVSSNLGLDSGIVLTTGRANTTGSSYGVNGPASVNASTNNSTAGDPALNALANSTTQNACILEFDLIPKGDTISFDYVFGSEEYNTSTCGTYNDAFAFFISGPGISGTQNMALVPGTTIPVTVNSINSGVPGSQGNIINCTNMGAGSPFTAYYVDNTGGTTITYKGFTTVLKAVHAVQPCSTYHLKMTIADAGNALFDSGVFIKAGSLKTNTFSIRSQGAVVSSAPFIVKGCTPGSFTVKRSKPGAAPQTMKFLIGGTAINGVDYATIADSVVIPANDTTAQLTITGLPTPKNGPRVLKLYLISPYSCNGLEIVDSASLTIYDSLYVSMHNVDTAVCAGIPVKIRAEGEPQFSYLWTPATGLNNTAILQPVATPLATTTYTLTVSFPNSGCAPKSASFKIDVSQPPVLDAGSDIAVCIHTPLQLHMNVTPAGQPYTYNWVGPDNFISTDKDASIYDAGKAAEGQYIATVFSTGCPPVTDTVNVTIKALPLPPDVLTPVALCLNSRTASIASSAHADFPRWYEAEEGGNALAGAPVPATNGIGVQQFYVSQVVNGCESKRSKIEVVVEKCCEDYLFIPSAFSPNGDGRNDEFRIQKGPQDKLVQFNIFNRWGQLIFTERDGAAWNGTQNGQPADMGVYFYDILIGCDRGSLIEKKGEITLVR